MQGTSIGSYVAGASMGTFIALYIYILFFDNLKNNRLVSSKNINYIISLVTLIVAMITFFNLL